MTKWIIGVLIVIGAVGSLFWYMYKHQSVGVPAAGGEPAASSTLPAMLAYASTTMGVSLQYPSDYTLNDSYTYQFSQQKTIHGVKFTVPNTLITGTNLSADTGVAVEQLPRAKLCTGDIFLQANVKAAPMTFGSTTFSVASSSSPGAGNLYEEIIYAIPGSKPCTAVRYFIHSGNIANYPAGTVEPFDRATLLSGFDSVRDSIVLTSSQP